MNLEPSSWSSTSEEHLSDFVLSSSSERTKRMAHLEGSIKELADSINILREIEQQHHALESTNNNVITVNVNTPTHDDSDSSDSTNCWNGLVNLLANMRISCGINSTCCGGN